MLLKALSPYPNMRQEEHQAFGNDEGGIRTHIPLVAPAPLYHILYSILPSAI